MPVTGKDVLIAAKALLPTPETWTKGTYARDKNGDSIGAHNSDATCRCMVGAMYYAQGQLRLKGHQMPNLRHVWDLLAAGLSEDGFTGPIPHFNDHPETTFEMVHAQFDRAIRKGSI